MKSKEQVQRNKSGESEGLMGQRWRERKTQRMTRGKTLEGTHWGRIKTAWRQRWDQEDAQDQSKRQVGFKGTNKGAEIYRRWRRQTKTLKKSPTGEQMKKQGQKKCDKKRRQSWKMTTVKLKVRYNLLGCVTCRLITPIDYGFSQAKSPAISCCCLVTVSLITGPLICVFTTQDQ